MTDIRDLRVVLYEQLPIGRINELYRGVLQVLKSRGSPIRSSSWVFALTGGLTAYLLVEENGPVNEQGDRTRGTMELRVASDNKNLADKVMDLKKEIEDATGDDAVNQREAKLSISEKVYGDVVIAHNGY